MLATIEFIPTAGATAAVAPFTLMMPAAGVATAILLPTPVVVGVTAEVPVTAALAPRPVLAPKTPSDATLVLMVAIPWAARCPTAANPATVNSPACVMMGVEAVTSCWVACALLATIVAVPVAPCTTSGVAATTSCWVAWALLVTIKGTALTSPITAYLSALAALTIPNVSRTINSSPVTIRHTTFRFKRSFPFYSVHTGDQARWKCR